MGGVSFGMWEDLVLGLGGGHLGLWAFGLYVCVSGVCGDKDGGSKIGRRRPHQYVCTA
jgi:hypothetical protein